ncbi:MAG: sigma 54-interacting transcriptional regulator, partial [Gammaproteobacteria bacterium]|nr:sigma 54-interacting transcriptional regulator [Gammaproteobacteria bacterium]
VKVDVRIIAATHQDLEARVEKGDFREDLFHRLNVIRIHIPALRERSEDIELLARHFLQSAATELNMEIKNLDDETLDFIRKLEWRGNVRQLQNTCRWLTVMAPGQDIHLDDLPPELLNKESKIKISDNWVKVLQYWAEQQLANGETDLFDKATPEFERVMIQTALRSAGGRRQDAARLLGCGRNTLTRKIKELGMEDTV